MTTRTTTTRNDTTRMTGVDRVTISVAQVAGTAAVLTVMVAPGTAAF
jgi:hypothetical protein